MCIVTALIMRSGISRRLFPGRNRAQRTYIILSEQVLFMWGEEDVDGTRGRIFR